jgi:glucan biosynthesis protein C
MQHFPVSTRVRYLDAARAIMLLLGIPFHISEIYRVSGGFFLDSPDHSYVASLLSGLVHSFRMPAFFLLSGYFAGMLMERQGRERWLRGRFMRLGIPLVLTAVSLGLLELVLINYFSGGMGWVNAVNVALANPAAWIQHRWFLITLLMFCVTLVLVAPLRPGLTQLCTRLAESPRAMRIATVIFWMFLLLMPFAAIATGKLMGDWLTQSAVVKEYVLNYARNVTFFFAGYVIFVVPDGLSRFTRVGTAWTAWALAALVVYLATYFAFYPPGQELPPVVHVIGIASEGVVGFLLARLFFAWMRAALDRESQIVAYLVDGSFCIYLVHGVFFVAFAGPFLNVPFNPIVEMVVINILTIVGCLLVYEIARRTPILAWPLNGGPFKFAMGWKSAPKRLASQES